nr:MAG: hypothetical protein [Aspergillus flavus partitivirus 1]BED98287.1 MAG: hypothetical protein [Aspergillus flavus partitivirus 1]BED98326.1 MAG: hypothetical protein [Aspergillus flavus partitivirus 1]
MHVDCKLGDGTVVTISDRFPKRWKKFRENALFVALLVNLFPFVEEALDETMYYAFMSDTEKLKLCVSTLAAKLVYQRFGHIHSDFFDSSYGQDVHFNVYEENGDYDFFCEWMSRPVLREFSVSMDAAKTLFDFLNSAEVLKEEEPEPVIQEPLEPVDCLVDNTPEIADPPLIRVYDTNEWLCPTPECGLCAFIRTGTKFSPEDLRTHPPRDGCLLERPPEYPIGSLFSSLLSRPGRIKHPGKAFRRIADATVSFRSLSHRMFAYHHGGADDDPESDSSSLG